MGLTKSQWQLYYPRKNQRDKLLITKEALIGGHKSAK